MSGVIDAIVKGELVVGPVTVNSDYTSESMNISGVEDTYSVQIEFSNGNGSVDITTFLEVSVDGNVYVPITETELSDTDDSGVVIYEVTGRGVEWLRVGITVTSGQFTLDRILVSGSRRH